MSTLSINKLSSINYINTSGTITSANTTNITVTNLNLTNLNMTNFTTSNLNVVGLVDSNNKYCTISGAATTMNVLNGADTPITTYWNGTTTTNGISQSSGVFTVANAGTYLVSVNLSLSANTSGSRALWILKNNDDTTNQRWGTVSQFATSSGGAYNISTILSSFIIPLAANDNLRVVVWQNSSSTLNLDSTYGNKFEMVKLC